MPRRSAVLLLLVLLPFPSVSAADADPVGVEGPDEQGVFTLLFDVHRASAGNATLALEVHRPDVDGAPTTGRALGVRALPAGTTRLNVSFLPAEGPGAYDVTLLLDGQRMATLAFENAEAGSSGEIAFEVADAPTYLNLTSDEVNAPGKTKAPGETLVTRFSVSDGNTLGDVDRVVWRIERGAEIVAEGTIAIMDPDATAAVLEHRFARSPMPAGAYTWTASALKAGAVVANASRTFVIREVAPTLVEGSLANVTPDERRSLISTIVVADKNAVPAAIEARVYRGSSRAEGSGFEAAVGAPTPQPDVDGAARASYPMSLVVPKGAAAGAYRVSLYVEGALLAALPFEVRLLPTLGAVAVSPDGSQLAFSVNATGEGWLTASLAGPSGTTRAESAVGEALRLDVPDRGEALAWRVALRARPDGPIVAERNGTWHAPLGGAALRVEPAHPAARAPGSWRIVVDEDVAPANASFTFTRWDGAAEPRLTGRLVGQRARVDAPPDLPAGLYHARLRVAWPNGTFSEAAWSFEAGPWVDLSMGEASVAGRVATVPLQNRGGLAIARLVVDPPRGANVTLVLGEEVFTPRAVHGRLAISGFHLAPGQEAALRVELNDEPRRSGRHVVPLRVLAQVGTS